MNWTKTDTGYKSDDGRVEIFTRADRHGNRYYIVAVDGRMVMNANGLRFRPFSLLANAKDYYAQVL